MKRILVTGGLGFIGSHLASSLLEDPDNEVHVVDNLSANVIAVDQLLESIRQDKPGRLEVAIQSVTEYEPSGKFDVIYHLASVVGPARVLEHAGYITESIVRDTYRMIRLAMNCAARLVNVSTSEIYGGGNDGFCDEETPRVVKPKASARLEYAAGKMAAEVAIENLCDKGELDAVTVRPFNVSGERQLGGGGFVLPRFIGQAVLGKPLTVFGDGQQVRAFTDVRDVASGIRVACERGESGRAYNVGNPDNRVTIEELARRVLAATKSTAGMVKVDPRTIYGQSYAEAEDKFPNAARLLGLGWQPQFSLNDTIAAVFEFMRTLPPQTMVQISGLEL